MNKKITIERLAEMTQHGLRDIEERLMGKIDAVDKKTDSLRKDMHQGFEMVLEEIRGLRGDVKIYHQGARVEYSMLQERVEALEKRMKKVEMKVGT